MARGLKRKGLARPTLHCDQQSCLRRRREVQRTLRALMCALNTKCTLTPNSNPSALLGLWSFLKLRVRVAALSPVPPPSRATCCCCARPSPCWRASLAPPPSPRTCTSSCWRRGSARPSAGCCTRCTTARQHPWRSCPPSPPLTPSSGPRGGRRTRVPPLCPPPACSPSSTTVHAPTHSRTQQPCRSATKSLLVSSACGPSLR
mmetsp:Transcript_13600/g.29112  ORF Transcript_13600/g.29112 Transcript_13600/m.29112 type:complete len:203 (+) Transcript_13600:296-904(+)